MKKILILVLLFTNYLVGQQLVWKEANSFVYNSQLATLTSEESKSSDSYIFSESELGYNDTGYIELSNFKLNGSAVNSQSVIGNFSIYLTFEDTFSLAKVHGKGYSITYAGEEDIIYIMGPQGSIAIIPNIILTANDILRIEKIDVNKMFLKYNSNEYLITDNYIEDAYIALRTNTANFSFNLGTLGFRPPTNQTDIVVEDFDRNWIYGRTFNNAGLHTNAGVTYYDALARPEQSQSRDMKTGKTWASQTLYDSQGRPAFQSFSSPLSPNTTPRFNYEEEFIKKPNGDPYENVDFETNPERPGIVGSQWYSQGWYYSSNNSHEPFQDITDRPYRRTVYDELNPGKTRMVVGGKIMDLNNNGNTDDPEDGFPQGFTYKMPATQEMYYAFGKTYFDNYFYACDGEVCAILKSYKTVSIDPHGNESVVFSNAEGKILATARSGGNTNYDVVSLIGEQGYIDVHIPSGINTFSFLGTASEYTVYDLRTGLLVDPPTSMSGGNIYRISHPNPSSNLISITSSGELEYDPGSKGLLSQINYYDYSLNYYDKAGNLKRTVQPMGFDTSALNLSTEFPNHGMVSTYEYNPVGKLLNTSTPDRGDAQFVYREDGQILFSLNTQQAVAEEFSYTLYDDMARPIESGVCTGTNPYFPLTFSIAPNFIVEENISSGSGSLTKTGALDDWIDSGFYSEEGTGTGNFSVSFKFIQGNEGVVGISESNIDGNYTTVEHAMYFLNGHISILNSGNIVLNSATSFTIGDTFSIERIENVIYYKKNNGVFFQESPWPVNTNYPELYVDGALYSSGTTAFNMSITGLTGVPIPSTPPEEFVISNDRKEQLFTQYDLPDTEGLWNILYPPGNTTSDPAKRRQHFVAGNVSKTYTREPETTTTWYSYDIYGRVEWIVQFVNGLGAKTIDYVYDDSTGAVTMVRYQKDNASERFTHKYGYNNVGELVTVWTSRDDVNFIEHAQYEYYETGALKRINLAEGLQGIDYIYTLEGQLKAINHPGLSASNDPGEDTNDAFGYVIDYHKRDYSRIDVGSVNWSKSGTDRFDGNIKGVRWGTEGLTPTGVQNAYQYTYNKDNWLNTAIFGSANEDINNHSVFVPNANGDYGVSNLTYDANGNILSLIRKKYTIAGNNAMDDLQYNYVPNSNRLKNVDDFSQNIAADGDLKDQDPENYDYNNIGQLIVNYQDEIGYSYYANGLVKSIFSIVSNDPKKFEFFYNDRGHRVCKKTTLPNNTVQKTYYVRDVSGSPMAIYSVTESATTEPSSNIEYPIYGLSRLGVADQGNIFKYQLSDHLGNVRAVIQRDESGTVMFNDDFNNTTTVPAGWTAGPNTAMSIDTTNDRLKSIVSNTSNNSLKRTFTVVAGHTYKIDFKVDLDQTPNILQYSIDVAGGWDSAVYTIAVNGQPTFNYTATTTGNVDLLFKLLNSYGGISREDIYYLDNVKVTDITTTNAPLMLAHKDYYPFGMPMPERNVEGQYRYGYQGEYAETDPETGMPAFELRLWDARIGRWLTTDPKYDGFSPYWGMNNNPIGKVDPDGGKGDDWYEVLDADGNGTGEIVWFEGSYEIEGYNHLGPNYTFTDGWNNVSFYNGQDQSLYYNGEFQRSFLEPVTVSTFLQENFISPAVSTGQTFAKTFVNSFVGAFLAFGEGLRTGEMEGIRVDESRLPLDFNSGKRYNNGKWVNIDPFSQGEQNFVEEYAIDAFSVAPFKAKVLKNKRLDDISSSILQILVTEYLKSIHY